MPYRQPLEGLYVTLMQEMQIRSRNAYGKCAAPVSKKLADLIKALLSAKIIKSSMSPWAMPIVFIVEENEVDIRLCMPTGW